jgi:beta-phosphoglucomutase
LNRLFDAVLFDFDGVLVDSEPVHWDCWNTILQSEFGYTVAWDEFAPACVGVHERGTVEWLCAQRNPPVPFEALFSLYGRKKQLFRERMARTGVIAPETVALVRGLREAGYRIAVVTSSGRVEVEPILQSSGLIELIDTAVYGGDVKNLKPAPDPYLLACDRLGTRDAVVIEDSPAGVASAQAAGLHVIRLESQSELIPRLDKGLSSSCAGGAEP